MDLLAPIAENLKLARTSARQFAVSCSGGVDSMVLLHAMATLRSLYSFELVALHINFKLRDLDSDLDEQAVREACERLGVKSLIHVAPVRSSAGIPELARKIRLEKIRDLPPQTELLEAHHLDDQLETFMLRLFRGAGVHGLSCMQMHTGREGRELWRPLLDIPKEVLRKYALDHGVHFREDRTNRETTYDRNWIRLALLPLVKERFPHYANSLQRTIAQLQEVDRTQNEQRWELERDIWTPGIGEHRLHWSRLRSLSALYRDRFLHDWFAQNLGVSLSFQKTRELSDLISGEDSFVWNAPQNWLVKGQTRSRQHPEEFIRVFKALQQPHSVGRGSIAL